MARHVAVLSILIGATCMSFAALMVRLIEYADGFQILFYRSFTLALAVLVVVCLKRKTSASKIIRQLDIVDAKIGALLCFAFITYIFAILNTSVASALFILSIAPVIAAILGWIFLGERPRNITWISTALALIGVLIMISAGLGTGRTLGNVLALISATCFASMLVVARASKKADILGGTFLGGAFCVVVSGLVAVFIGNGLAVTMPDLLISLAMGAISIGLGIALVTLGTPFVPAAEVSLLVLLESVLSPVWVGLFLGETMNQREIIGGAIVLIAVVGLALFQPRKARTKSKTA